MLTDVQAPFLGTPLVPLKMQMCARVGCQILALRIPLTRMLAKSYHCGLVVTSGVSRETSMIV